MRLKIPSSFIRADMLRQRVPASGSRRDAEKENSRMSPWRFDRAFRRFVPSVARISYNPFIKIAGDALSTAFSLPFPELRNLPPNHLRIRIGVGNRILANHVNFLQCGSDVLLRFFSRQYCSFDSDMVELGCGCGRIAYPLKEDWFEGTFVGVDIDQEMIDYCQRTFPQDRFRFVLSPHKSATYSSGKKEAKMPDGKRLVIADAESKDFVYSISLYSHLLEGEVYEYLSETFRILRHGGLMYLTFFCMEHAEIGQRWTFRYRSGNAYTEDKQYPEAAVAYDAAVMTGLAKKVGFREISVIPHGSPPQSVLLARR